MVSVIVPAFGTADLIAETLDSVLAQSRPDFEIIVINDNDPDTANLERALVPYRDRIVYIVQEVNQGPSAARNAGIKAASGDYIALLDSDDIWLPHYLQRQLQYLHDNPDVDVVYANAEIFGPRSDGRSFMESCPSTGPVTFRSLVEQQCSVLTSSVLGRRDAFVNAGLFDPEFAHSEDFHLWLRMLLSGYRIGYHHDIVMRYRKRLTSQSSNDERMYTAAADVLRKVLTLANLSEEQRRLATFHSRRFDALASLTRSKLAVAAGDYKYARQCVARANAHFRSVKLFGIVAALWVMPAVVGRLYNRRQLMQGAS